MLLGREKEREMAKGAPLCLTRHLLLLHILRVKYLFSLSSFTLSVSLGLLFFSLRWPHETGETTITSSLPKKRRDHVKRKKRRSKRERVNSFTFTYPECAERSLQVAERTE